MKISHGHAYYVYTPEGIEGGCNFRSGVWQPIYRLKGTKAWKRTKMNAGEGTLGMDEVLRRAEKVILKELKGK